MRILQINSVCGFGSTGRIATDIHSVLVGQGHESYVAYGRGVAAHCDTTIRVGNNRDTYLHVAKTRLFDGHGFGSRSATREFISKLVVLDPDVIHLHNIHGYYINCEILFDHLKEANKRVVWTLHDCWPFTGHCAHFDYSGCECWTGEHKCTQARRYPASFLINNSRNNYKRKKAAFVGVKNMTIVTPSQWLASLTKQSFLNQYAIETINNGIDLRSFQPANSDFRMRYGLIDKYIILGVASIWDSRKGLEYFWDLNHKLESNEVLVIVGLSDRQIRDLPENIIGITRTSNINELAGIYSTSDVFVNPTLEDNFPTTNLEALACGTPVITFNTGGSAESVSAETGYVVEKGSLEELLSAIRRIKERGKISYSQQCRNRAVELYNKEERVKDYLNIYSS